MYDRLRRHFSTFIQQQQWGILCTHGAPGVWAIPTWKCSRGFELFCLLPRWSDSLYHIEEDPQVVVLFLDLQPRALRWLEVRGAARPAAKTTWNQLAHPELLLAERDDSYAVIEVTPTRIDWFDESMGWGFRETLDF